MSGVILSPSQYNNIYSEHTKIIISNKVNDEIHYLLSQLDKERQKVAMLKDALEKAISGSEVFVRFADCRKDSWVCNCEFCRDVTSSKKLREAREALEKLKEME